MAGRGNKPQRHAGRLARQQHADGGTHAVVGDRQHVPGRAVRLRPAGGVIGRQLIAEIDDIGVGAEIDRMRCVGGEGRGKPREDEADQRKEKRFSHPTLFGGGGLT